MRAVLVVFKAFLLDFLVVLIIRVGGSSQFSSVPVPVRFWQNFGSRFPVLVRFCYVLRLKPDEEVKFYMLGKNR